MKLRAIFWNTQAFTGSQLERDNLKKAVEDFATARHTHINQVMISTDNNTDLQNGLSKAGIFNRMVLVLGADSLKARGVSVTPAADTFTEALGALNHMGRIAKQELIKPDEVAVITDSYNAATAAAKAGMMAVCINGDNEACLRRTGRMPTMRIVPKDPLDVSNAAAFLMNLSMQ